MKSLPLVLLIAASALLLSVTGQSYNQPQCCQGGGCEGCVCRSASFKYTVQEGEAIRKQLKDNCMEYNKLGSSEDAPDNTAENATGKEDSPNTNTNSTKMYGGYNYIECLMCKIAHC